MQIKSLPWAFQQAINQGRASPLTWPKWGWNSSDHTRC